MFPQQHNHNSDDDNHSNETVLRAWRDDVLAQQLDLPHIPLEDIRRALQFDNNDPANQTKPQQQQQQLLQQLALDAYRQQVKVQQVLALLDPAGKGCVMLQDLQRAVQELELDNSTNNDGEDWSMTALEEMMTLFVGDSSDSNSNSMVEDEEDASSILLSLDDLLRIARQGNL